MHARIGEHDLYKSKDCVYQYKKNICSKDPVNIPVDNYFIHPSYDSTILKNDIGLVKLKNVIIFTRKYNILIFFAFFTFFVYLGFIQPTCLPFERNFENRNLTGEKLLVSGWGKTDSSKSRYFYCMS